jgi:hypothetical protein
MRALVCLAIGVLCTAPAGAQELPFHPNLWEIRTYDLCVTPMDWRHESRIGLTGAQVESQVIKRLLEGAGLSRCDDPHGFSDARIHVDLDVRRERFLEISYRVRVVVCGPRPAENGFAPVAVVEEASGPEIWAGSFKGGSSRGRFAFHFRKELDAVLDRLLDDWRAAQR